MYVRWTHRTRVRGGLFGDAGQVRWKASLIESVRVDGKPRQRQIALLGSFRDSDIENPNYGHRSRCDFWDTVTARLDRLGVRVSTEERKKIEDAIARKVKPPTPEDRIAAAKNRAEFEEWLRVLKTGRGRRKRRRRRLHTN